MIGRSTASQAKSHFLTGITHELRTPLNGILGYAQLLRLEGGLSPAQLERVETMLECGRHLLGMINAVLDLAQIEAGQLDLRPIDIDLPQLARACLEVVMPPAKAKGLAVYLAPVPDRLPHLVADATRLRQVLVNLLGNAVKFTASGAVELRLRRLPDEQKVRLEVRDTGPGISATQRAHLFSEFQRLEAANVAATEGNGLGLAITARLVREMGGQIGHDDNPDGGSVFWVELPAAAEAVADEAASGPLSAPSPEPRSALRVLVVDDMAINREIAAGFLGFAGHHVVGADSGAAAIELAKTEDFDLILMDVLMPGMDGLEATRRIRALAPPRGLVPIVALSAQAFAEQIEKCRQAGMTEHISKPFEQANLVAVVERVAAEPVRQQFADLPVGGQIPEAPDEDTLFDRAAMAKISAMILQGNVTKHFEIADRAQGRRCWKACAASKVKSRRTKLAADAHRLGGTLGMFGFNRLATSVRRFEAAVEQNATDVADKRDVLVAAVKEAIDIMRQEILAASAPSSPLAKSIAYRTPSFAVGVARPSMRLFSSARPVSHTGLARPRKSPHRGRRMACRQPRPATEQLFSKRARSIVVLEQAPSLQFGHHEVRHVHERARGQRVGEVEAVDAGFLHPGAQFLGDLLSRSDHHRAAAADRGMPGDFPNGPFAVRIGGGESFQRRGLRIRFVGEAHDLDPVASRRNRAPVQPDIKRQRAFLGHIAQIVLILVRERPWRSCR